MMTDTPLAGIIYFIDGFKLICRPGLRRFVLIPLVLNALLFIGMFFIVRHYVIELNSWLSHYLPNWLHWLRIVLWLLFFVSFYLLFVYTFITVSNVLCAPFNSFLAEKVEFYLTGKIQETRTLLQNIKDVPRIVGRQLNILGYYLICAAVLFTLLFIPVIQLAAAIIWFLFHAWFVTITYMDYPTDNHRISMPQVRSWLSERRWIALELGICMLLAMMVPILNILVMPAGVAAATKWWVEENRSKLSSRA